MEIIETDIKDVLVLRPRVFEDARGYLLESYNQEVFDRAVGRPIRFVQDNLSRSSYGVVRGLHFQQSPHAQSKLVSVVSGRVLDVAVDIRRGSPTFGRHVAVELSDENHLQLFIPRGFAHGFAVLSPLAVFTYKCDNFYAPQSEAGIAFDDPALGIDWHVPTGDAILSEKDRLHPVLEHAKCFDDNEPLY